MGLDNKRFPQKYNVVSCMFSIHYFFETEAKLDNFIQNVVELIDEQGYFIVTFMDGKRVEKELENNNRRIVGIDEVSKSVIWAVEAHYKKTQRSVYNKKIKVFIENTGRMIEENIVDFAVLEAKLKKHRIDVVETELFETTFKTQMSIPNDKLHKNAKNILDNLNQNEMLKRFSFLNRWVVFKKN